MRRDVLTPREFAVVNVRVLRHVWKGVRDGDQESLHQARVATRRLRAALEVCGGADSDEVRLCRSLGHAFGRVRELDVAHDLMTTFDARVADAACAIALFRREIDARRQEARRRLIKSLDDVDVAPLARLRPSSRLAALQFWKDWRSDLRSVILSRTAALQAAVENAPRVYMPNRLHRVRIALKKLRYELEVAEAAGAAIDRHVMRDARKLQDVLGRLHDVHSTNRLAARVRVRGRQLAAEAAVVDAVMKSECARLHEKYNSGRDRLRVIGDYCTSFFAPRPAARAARLVIRALPVAGLVALPLRLGRTTALPNSE